MHPDRNGAQATSAFDRLCARSPRRVTCLAPRFCAQVPKPLHPIRSVALVEELVSLKKCLGRALVYLVLEIGALCGVPMRPDEIEKLMKIADRRVTHVKRNQKGDVT